MADYPSFYCVAVFSESTEKSDGAMGVPVTTALSVSGLLALQAGWPVYTAAC